MNLEQESEEKINIKNLASSKVHVEGKRKKTLYPRTQCFHTLQLLLISFSHIFFSSHKFFSSELQNKFHKKIHYIFFSSHNFVNKSFVFPKKIHHPFFPQHKKIYYFERLWTFLSENLVIVNEPCYFNIFNTNIFNFEGFPTFHIMKTTTSGPYNALFNTFLTHTGSQIK